MDENSPPGPARPHVVTAVLHTHDRVLLCHRTPDRRHYPDVWDLPGGHVEPGETAPDALVRELHEELGITIRAPTGPPLATITADDYALQAWLVQHWDGTVHNAAPHEHDALSWLDATGLAALADADLGHPGYRALLLGVLAGPVR